MEETIARLVHTRWTKEQLELFLSHHLDENVKLYDVDEDGLVSDYCFIFEHGGFDIDLYYLKAPFGDCEIYITEYAIN
jgi:hypothetical protein